MHVRRNFFILFLIFFASAETFAGPAKFTYQGQIIKPNGQALEASTVHFTIEILSPEPELCVLYEESHTLNMNNSNGIFSVTVGEGAKPGDGSYEDVTSLADALNNSIGTVNPTTCALGPSYTADPSDGRKLRVTFDDGSGPVTLAQDHNVVSVPYASSASSVGGITATEILRINDGTGFNLNQTNLEFVFNDSNWTELQALLDGTSGSFTAGAPTSDVDNNNQKIINLANPNPATDSDAVNVGYARSYIGGQQVDTTDLGALGVGQNGEVLTWDGTQWNSEVIDDVNKLPLGGGTMTGSINMGNQDITNANDLSANNNISATNNLSVGQDATVGNNLTVSGGIGVTNGINSGSNIIVGNESELRLEENTLNGSDYVSLKSPAALTAPVNLILPGNDGDPGQYLQTDGSGVLSWQDVNAGVTQVFGRSGNVVALAGDYDADLITFDNTYGGDVDTATEVQGAIEELSTEKVAKSGDSMTGNLVMDLNGGATTELRFQDTGTKYVGFQAPNTVNAVSSFVWTLPDDDGGSGQVLQTSGAGVLSWTSVASESRTVTAGQGLTGGGDLSANRTFDIGAGNGITVNADDIEVQGGSGISVDGTGVNVDVAGTADKVSAAVAADSLLIQDSEDLGNLKEITRANFVLSEAEVDAYANNNGYLTAVTGTELENVWSTNGILVKTGPNTFSQITDSSSDWDTAFGWGDHSVAGYALDANKVDRAGDTMTGGLYIDGSADSVQLAVDGTAGQTANLVEFRQSDGTVVASVADDGVVAAGTDLTTKNYVDTAISGFGAGDILDGGNTTGAPVTVGTNDGFSLNLETNNSTAMTIDSSGNIGIGTTTPGYKLEVEGSFNLNSALWVDDNIVISSTRTLRTENGSATTPSQTFASDADTGMYSGGNGSDVLGFSTGGIERLRLDASGNVGIGTGAPSSKLQIVGGVQIGDDAALCDGTKAGTLKYSGTSVSYCDGTSWQAFGTAAGGEVNDGTNVGTGEGLFKAKNGLNLEFKSLGSANTKIAVSSGVDDVTLTIDESAFDPTAIPVGTTPLTATTLQAAIVELEGDKVSDSRSILSGAGLSGGGDLSADRTLAVDIAGTADKASAAVAADSLLIRDSEDLGNLKEITRSNFVLSESEVDTFVANNGYAADTDKVNIVGDTMTGQLFIDGGSDEVQLAVDAETLQTVNLVEFRDSASSPFATISSDGSITAATDLTTKNYVDTAITTATSGSGDILDGGNTTGAPVTIGTNDGFSLNLETNNSTAMTVDTSGNVGVGTTAPNANIEVLSPLSVFRLSSTDGTVGDGQDLAAVEFYNNDANGTGVGAKIVSEADGTAGYQSLGFHVGQGGGTLVEAMHIDGDSGNIGVGTGAPSDAFHIHVADSKDGLRITDNTSGNGIQIQGYYPAVNFNQYWDGSNTRIIGDGYSGFMSMDPGVGDINFGVSPTGTAGNTVGSSSFVLRLMNSGDTRVLNNLIVDGNVGIGTTTPTSLFQVAGGVQIGDDAALCDATKAGTLKYSGSSVSYCDGTSWEAFGTAAGGEVNDGANVGLGVGLFKAKNGLNLEFKSLDSANGKIAVSSGTDDVTLTIDESAFDPTAIPIGTTPLTATTLQAAIVELEGDKVSSSRSVLSGNGLTGGGDLSADRTLAVQGGNAITVDGTGVHVDITNETAEASVAAGDELLIYDSSVGALRKMTRSNFVLSNAEVEAIIADDGYVIDGGNAPIGALDVGTTNAQNLNFLTNNSTAMTVDTSGSVGIGTTTPLSALHIDGASGIRITDGTGGGEDNRIYGENGDLRYTSQGGHWTILDNNGTNATNDDFRIYDENLLGTPLFLVENNGNVGIGTTAPASKLDVAGSIRAEQICDESGANCQDISAGWSTGSGDFMADGSVAMTGQFDAIDGNQGNPAISFASDANTGIFRGAADQLAFTTGGNEALRIDNSGRVGVGTPTPTGKFHAEYTDNSVYASSSAAQRSPFDDGEGVLITRTGNQGDDYLSGQLFTATGTFGLSQQAYMGAVTSGGGGYTPEIVIGQATGSSSYEERLRIDRQGNIGIGTTVPNSKLQIVGGVQIGDDAALCDGTKEGTLKYVGGAVSFCDGTSWEAFGTAAGGEVNDGTNVGTGEGLFKAKNGLNLEFKSLGSANGKITLSSDADNVTLTIDESAFTPTAIPIGTTPLTATTLQAAIVELEGDKVSDSRSIISGNGLTGGGDLTADRTLAVQGGDAITVDGTGVHVDITNETAEASVAAGDELLIYDTSAGALRKMARSNFVLSSAEVEAIIADDGYVIDGGNAPVGSLDVGTTNAQNLNFLTNGSTAMTVTTAGNIGIGTISPGQSLDIRGTNSLPATSGSTQTGTLRVSSSGTTMTLDSGVHSGSGAWIQATQRNLLNNSFNLLLNPNGGNVGIGTTAPASKLDVAGTIRAEQICDEAGLNCQDISAGWSSGSGDFLANGSVPMTGAFEAIYGTSGAPGITFNGDEDTGITRAAPDELSLVAGGNGVMSLNNSGITLFRHLFAGGWDSTVYSPTSVGLSTPNGDTATYYNSNNLDGSFGGITMRVSNGLSTNQQGYMGLVAESTGDTPHIVIGQQTGASSYQESVRIDDGGNFGIGTTAPSAKLDVAGQVVAGGERMAPTVYESVVVGERPNGDGVASISLTPSASSGKGFKLDVKDDGVENWFAVYDIVNDAHRFVVEDTGHVGINTRTPAVELDVDTGTINAAAICDENNANCLDLSAGVGGGYSAGDTLLAGDGTAAAPGISFNNDPDTGFQGLGLGNIGLSFNGVNRMDFSQTGLEYNATGAFKIGAGTGPATPSYSFSGDDDTGLYRPSANNIAFSTASSEVMRIDASGNLGIGTTAPGSALDINGAESMRGITAPALAPAGQGRIYFDSTSNTYKVSQNGSAYTDLVGGGGGSGDFMADGSVPMTNQFLSVLGNAGAPGITFDGDTDTGVFSPAANSIAFTNNGSESVRIDASGRVGIGTATPFRPLTVQGDIVSSAGALTALMKADGGLGGAVFGADSNHPVLFYSNGAERMRITPAGSLGIGTSAPSTNLDVIDNLGSASLLVGGAASGDSATLSLREQAVSNPPGDGFDIRYDGTINALNIRGTVAGTPVGTFVTIDRDSGSVGIGTTTPAVALDVNTGTINAASICDENNANCLDLSAGVGGGSGDILDGGNSNGAAVSVGTNDNYDFNLEANGSTVATARSDGSFMVGSPNMMGLGGALTRVESNPWDASGDYAHINNEMYKNGNSHTGKIIGIRNFIRSDSSNPQDRQISAYNKNSNWGNSLNQGVGSYNELENMAGTVGDYSGVISDVKVTGGTVNNAYGFRAMNSNAGTLTNAYGLYIDDLSGTNQYGVYQAGASDTNYFAGNVGIGTSTPSIQLEVEDTSFWDNSGAKEKVMEVTAWSGGPSGTNNDTIALATYAENEGGGSGNSSTALEAYGESGNDAVAQSTYGVTAFANTHPGDTGYALAVFDGQTTSGGTVYGLYIDLDDPDATNYGVYQESANNNYFAGNVGIGTASPQSALEVNGAIRNSASISNGAAVTTIDFADGNLQYTSESCQTFDLHNLKDGGTYSFAVQGTTSATCVFNAFSDNGSTALTVHLPSGHGATTAGEHTVYSIMVMGTHAYFAWVTEFD